MDAHPGAVDEDLRRVRNVRRRHLCRDREVITVSRGVTVPTLFCID